MGGRILEATYFKDDGISMVVKADRWGTFADVAKCSDEDMDVASDFTGCSFAEYKCDIQSQHEKMKYYKARYDGIDMVYNNLKQSIPTSEKTMISLNRQRNIAWRDYQIEKERYWNLRDNYKNYTDSVIRSRKNIINKINQEVEQ